MDNDLPAEPNDYMAAAYADLAHQARIRATDNWETEFWHGTAGRLQRLADLYAERRELTTGEATRT